MYNDSTLEEREENGEYAEGGMVKGRMKSMVSLHF